MNDGSRGADAINDYEDAAMSVSEHDVEALEEWLDGELSVEQTDALRRRLSSEPDLNQALERLRADRQLRERVWQAMEPASAEVDSVVATVRFAVRKEALWAHRMRVFRSVSGMAASIVLVFMAGWISRSRLQTSPLPSVPGTGGDRVAVLLPAQNSSSPGAMPQPFSQPVIRALPGSQQPGVSGGSRLVSSEMPLPNDPDNVLFNGSMNSGPQQNAISSLRPTYKVVVIDPWGRVVDAQQFETRDDARKFTEQLNRFQGRQQQSRRSDQVVPVTDQP